VQLPPEHVIGILAERATTRFRSLAAPDKRCEFVLAGWSKLEPFLGTVSNYSNLQEESRTEPGLRHHIPSFSQSRVPLPRFRHWIQRFKNPTEHHYVVNVCGDINPTKLTKHFRGLEGLLKKRVATEIIGGACRQIVLEAARHSETIGRDLITIEMDRDGGTFASYHSCDGTESMLIPDLLSPRGCVIGATLTAAISGSKATIRLKGKTARRLAHSKA
jgi:hypothetical protein